GRSGCVVFLGKPAIVGCVGQARTAGAVLPLREQSLWCSFRSTHVDMLVVVGGAGCANAADNPLIHHWAGPSGGRPSCRWIFEREPLRQGFPDSGMVHAAVPALEELQTNRYDVTLEWSASSPSVTIRP